jgi:hypothetical protein
MHIRARGNVIDDECQDSTTIGKHTRLKGERFAFVPDPSKPRTRVSMQDAPQTAQKVLQQISSMVISAVHRPSLESQIQFQSGNKSDVCNKMVVQRTSAFPRKYREGR